MVPWDSQLVRRSGLETSLMPQDYARRHVLTARVLGWRLGLARAVGRRPSP